MEGSVAPATAATYDYTRRLQTPMSMMTSDLDKVRAHLEALPIFPLPTALLLPYEVLPLHIFEPRYREMIADAIEGGRPLAIAQLAKGWEGDYEGRPAVEPLCGVGIISRHEKLPDGRYNVLIRGVARIEILQELPARRSYREVRAALVNDRHAGASDEEEAAAIEGLRRMLFALCAARPGPGASALAHLAAQSTDASSLADIVAAALYTDFDRRKRALVTLDPIARLTIAQTAIAELLVGGKPGGEVQYRN